ncbi:glycosyltransferase family 9 protein [Candidatus Neptunochlamydia vexilliferae]|nr:glycosyltransferase family 9 protein [Candidatus Neptunochlamydia vexilliferae]
MEILIIKTSSLGDIIQSFPVLALLKQTYPHSQIDWVVEKSFCELLEAHPDIRQAIPVEARKWKKNLFAYRSGVQAAVKNDYDVSIDLQGNIKSGLIAKFISAKQKVGTSFSSAPEWPNGFFLTHRYPLDKKKAISLQYLSLVQNHFALQQAPIPKQLFLTITPEEEAWIDEQTAPPVRYMVCPGSQWENKKLFLPTWIELLKEFAHKKNPHYYFVWGNEKEEQEARALHAQFPEMSTLLPHLSLPLWQRLMAKMDGIFSVDSSALHLAATTGVPTYSFFGPSSAAVYKPAGAHHHALQGPCPYGKTFTKRCPALRTCKTGACIKGLSSKTLEEIIR